MNEAGEYRPTEEDIKRQEEFFALPTDKQKEIRDKVLYNATEEKRVADFRDQFEVEKSLMAEKDGLEFDEVKKGDIFLFETMGEIKFEAGEFFEKVQGKIDQLEESNELYQKGVELLKVGKRLLEMADKRPYGDGERQLLFDQIRDLINLYPQLFQEENINGRYRVEVTGKRTLKTRFNGKEECFLAKIESDRRGVGGLTARIPKSSFKVDNISGILGGMLLENVKRKGDKYLEWRTIPRIGRIYK